MPSNIFIKNKDNYILGHPLDSWSMKIKCLIQYLNHII
jgi:hypothetical protein